MSDFVVLAAAWMLDQKVSTYDEQGNRVPDDGEYQRRGAEIVYTFGEFMRDSGFLHEGVKVVRDERFELRWSDLTDEGQEFTRAHLDKWMRSMDRKGPSATIDASGLERRLTSFRNL